MAEYKKSSELIELIKSIEEAMKKAIAIVKEEKEKAAKNADFVKAAAARNIEKTLLEAQQILFLKKD